MLDIKNYISIENPSIGLYERNSVFYLFIIGHLIIKLQP